MTAVPASRHRRMSHLRGLVALVVAAAFAGSVPADAATRPVLRSTLRLRGSGGAFEYVRLARPLPVPDKRTLSVSGDRGRIVLMLVADGDPAEHDPTSFIADRLPLDAGGDWLFTTARTNYTGVLPAGNYRAYLLAATPTTVSIGLPGQPDGTVDVATRVRVPYRISEIAVDRLPTGGYRQVSETNDTFVFSRPGRAFGLAMLTFSMRHDLTLGGCWYRGRPPPGESVAQVCAGGAFAGVGGGWLVPEEGRWRTVQGGTLSVTPGEWTFGICYQTTGILEDVRRFNAWVQYLP